MFHDLVPVAAFLGWSGLWLAALRAVVQSESRKRHAAEDAR